jgi:hypothetical protein
MIIEYDFADSLLNEIETELFRYNEEEKIVLNNYELKESKFEFIFESDNYCLPLFTRNITEIIQLSKSYFQIYFNAIKKEHPTLVKNGIEQTIDNKFQSAYPPDVIFTAIRDKISNLVFNYNKVLDVTRNRDFLFGILDEEKILINHLNKYNEILNSSSIQLEFFNGIILNKKISDLLTRIYIEFIKLRLNILNPILSDNQQATSYKFNDSQKLIWDGSQKELCELIVELQNKGWLNKIKPGTLRKTCKTICNLFDLSKSQIKTESNIEESFYQIMKGENDSATGLRTYDNIFSDNYKRKFDKIENRV